MAEKTEFEFPDEIEAKKSEPKEDIKVEVEQEPTIEVVDDRSDEEKNYRKVGEKPKAPDEEELSEYSDRVKKRIDHLYKASKSAERKAEEAMREREEAIRIAQLVVEENKKLKGSMNQSQTALLEQAKKVVGNEVEDAKRKYKEAYESGNSDALVDAQEELTAAKIKLDRVNNFKPALQDTENEVQTAPRTQERPPIDQKAAKWQEENSWFGADDEMTSFALGLHSKLVKNGVDPKSEEYYEKLNSRMRQVFPENFESENHEDLPETEVKRPRSNVVAPATRSSSPRKVTLTQTQVNIAKRLGVPLELYARKVAEEMRK
jgi:hypothetical protein